METNRRFRVNSQLVFGLIVITLGVLFTLDNLNVLSAHYILRYWPALLVVWGITKLSTSRGGGQFFGLMLTIGGGLLLLDRLYYIDFDWNYFWPLMLIAWGGSMLWNSMTRYGRPVGDFTPGGDAESTVSHFAMMGGVKRYITSQDFRGGDLSAIMGGVDIDLRQASIKSGDAVIDVFAFWGGISLKIPTDWNVVVTATPIMGGIEIKTNPPTTDTGKRLVIKGTAIMGGVEIKN